MEQQTRSIRALQKCEKGLTVESALTHMVQYLIFGSHRNANSRDVDQSTEKLNSCLNYLIELKPSGYIPHDI